MRTRFGRGISTTTVNINNKSNRSKPESLPNKWGSRSDVIGWIINAGVAVITLFLFAQTRDSLEAANTANTISQISSIEARRANEIADRNYQLSKRGFDSTIEAGKLAALESDKINALQAKALEAQIQTINEARYQFNNETGHFCRLKVWTSKGTRLRY
jgi:hypothetical protein